MGYKNYNKNASEVLNDFIEKFREEKNISMNDFALIVDNKCKEILPVEDMRAKKGNIVKDTMLNNYFSEKKRANGTTIPPPILASILQVLEISYDSFMTKVLEKSNNSTWKSLSNLNQDPIYSLLNEVFKNENGYIINSRNMDLIFPNNEHEFKLNFAHLPVKSDMKDLHGNEVPFQTGTLTFMRDKEKDSVCRLSGILDIDSKGGRNAELEGFAMLLNPDTDDSSCWCFLKRKNNPNIILWTICFRLKSKNSVWEAPHIAYLLSLRTRDSLPLIHRIMLWQTNHEKLKENPLTGEEIKRLLGYVRLNTKAVKIKSDDWKITENYINHIKDNSEPLSIDKDKYKDIQEHFNILNQEDKENIIKILDTLNLSNETHTFINYSHISKNPLMGTNRNLLEKVPLFTSWLRRIDQHHDYNKLRDELNQDISKMFSLILKQRDSGNSED